MVSIWMYYFNRKNLPPYNPMLFANDYICRYIIYTYIINRCKLLLRYIYIYM